MSCPAQSSEAEPGAAPAADTARLIGVASELKSLSNNQYPTHAGSPQQWKSLVLHQRIYESVTIAQLQADATVASIDNEIAHSAEVRGYLADRRDRTVTRANLFSALLGGGLGAVSAGLQISSKRTNAAVATGIAGGTVSAGLAVYGIQAQRGGMRNPETESNMLAEFFGRPELPTSHYPRIVWQFLNEAAPSDSDRLIRRDRLIRTWLELNRLDSLTTPAGKLKIERVTSMPSQHQLLTIDDLEDRIAMLQDVRAKLSYLKRDLAALLLSLPPLPVEDNTSPDAR